MTLDEIYEMDCTDAREAARKLITELGLEVNISYKGKGTDDKSWEHDAWDIAMGTLRTTYKTGLGQREYRDDKNRKFKPTKYDLGSPNTLHREAYDRTYLKPVKPDPVDVVCCLVRDGEAIDKSFRDWCDEWDADSDSIKVLKMYENCCDIGQRLRSQIKHDQREMLAALANQL